MEAAEDVLGLGLSSGFKFEPDDDELVEYYLLRRILGKQLPLEGMIFEDDPLSATPWKLFRKHKRKDEAFFFANGQAIHGRGSRQKRTCVHGGCWEGQKVCVEGDRLRVPGSGSGSGMEITWRKYMLNFHAQGEDGSSGWVMHEYTITSPPDLASSPMRLYRIRFNGHGKKRKREPDDSCGDDNGARAPTRQARAEPDLLDGNISEAATSYSDQHYHYQGANGTYDRPKLDSFQDFVVPDSSFLPGADLGDYADAGTAMASAHQDFLGGNTMDLGGHGATSLLDQEAPGVMNGHDGAAPAVWMLPFGQEIPFSATAMDDSFLDFELPGFNYEEFIAFQDPGGLEAHLHDQYSSAGVQAQSSMQLMPAQHIWLHDR